MAIFDKLFAVLNKSTGKTKDNTSEFKIGKGQDDDSNPKTKYTYIGDWKNKLPNGYGIKIYESGHINRGFFKDGLLNGRGVSHSSNMNSIDEGIYLNDNLEGFGVYYQEDNEIFRGMFHKGQPNGIGETCIDSPTIQKDLYLGEYKDGELQGFGAVRTESFIYVGDFVNGCPHGQGKYIYDSGNTLEGNFVNGELTGNAKHYRNGRYIGIIPF